MVTHGALSTTDLGFQVTEFFTRKFGWILDEH